jgi:hypothetical protein
LKKKNSIAENVTGKFTSIGSRVFMVAGYPVVNATWRTSKTTLEKVMALKRDQSNA